MTTNPPTSPGLDMDAIHARRAPALTKPTRASHTKSAMRLRVEATLQAGPHTALSACEVAQAACCSQQMAGAILQRAINVGEVRRLMPTKAKNQLFVWSATYLGDADERAARQQPAPNVAPPRTNPHNYAFDPTTYAWPHLQAHHGRPEADAHKAHSSRRGEQVVPYSGPLPMCVGAGLGIYGPGSTANGRARGGV